jgi:hypothetical protein
VVKELVIYAKKGKMFVYGIICLVFVIIGVFLTAASFSETGGEAWKLRIAGIASVLFFGLVFVYWIKTLVHRKPTLIISEEGINDQSTYIAAGLIKWEEIADIDFVQFSGQTFLGIYTHDPELIINRSSAFKRMLNKMNKGLLDTQVNIPVKILDCSMEELIETIGYYFKDHMPEAEEK